LELEPFFLQKRNLDQGYEVFPIAIFGMSLSEGGFHMKKKEREFNEGRRKYSDSGKLS